MEYERTSISVTKTLAEQLHELKNYGDSHEDVIWRALIEAGYVEEDPRKG